MISETKGASKNFLFHNLEEESRQEIFTLRWRISYTQSALQGFENIPIRPKIFPPIGEKLLNELLGIIAKMDQKLFGGLREHLPIFLDVVGIFRLHQRENLHPLGFIL